MQELDLHGVKHQQVHRIVEDFILMTSEPMLKIIVGNRGNEHPNSKMA